MESNGTTQATLITTANRPKCAACFKKYNKREHLIDHMRKSYHSVHQPKCGVCQKHFKSLEALREHLTGPVAKENCSAIFSERGCTFCMGILDNQFVLTEHKEICCPPASLAMHKIVDCGESIIFDPPDNVETCNENHHEAVALDCTMVGGGSDGTLDLLIRVCLVDEDENILFHTFVQPTLPVTNYRYEITGLTERNLKDAMPLNEVHEKILQILRNGESEGMLAVNGGKARVLVGHSLDMDLDCLRMSYPNHMLRDTAKYHPLMKTNDMSNSLKYLVKTYLGYDIRTGLYDPYEDCVAVMRLYKRFRSQKHEPRVSQTSCYDVKNVFDSWEFNRFEKVRPMTPDELFDISKSNYKCWCLDSP